MGDVAWMSLTIWPWNDEWLRQDEELWDAFNAADLVEDAALVGAMNGECIGEDDDRTGPRTVISGEMTGGSWFLRGECDVLPVLRSRGIAYVIVGDAKYEWDGDEEWWHPGMKEPFSATANESGRVLTGDDYRLMKLAASPAAARLEDVNERLREARERLAAFRRASRERGEPHHGIPGQQETVKRLMRERDRIVRRPAPVVPVEDQVAAFFDADPYAWKPGPRYRPKLKLEPEDE